MFILLTCDRFLARAREELASPRGVRFWGLVDDE